MTAREFILQTLAKYAELSGRDLKAKAAKAGLGDLDGSLYQMRKQGIVKSTMGDDGVNRWELVKQVPEKPAETVPEAEQDSHEVEVTETELDQSITLAESLLDFDEKLACIAHPTPAIKGAKLKAMVIERCISFAESIGAQEPMPTLLRELKTELEAL